jgi:phosphatidylserine/phosphatidylglycerophosphate/cardiolipin synthase-like enzyme
MFSGKRRLVTGLVAASLLATMVAETGQSPAAAKALDSAVKTNSISTGDYGPVCPSTSSSRIKLINNGTARTYSIAELTACANYAVPSGSPTPEISPSPRPSSSTTASPSPTPSLIALPGANSITYSIGEIPAGMTATISGNTLTVSTTAVASDSTSLELIATHAYLDPLEASYEYLGTTEINVPISIKPASPPTCRSFTTTTLRNESVIVPLAYDSIREGGCQASVGYGSLTYKVSSLQKAKSGSETTLRPDLVSFQFFPQTGWISPNDSSKGGASFNVVATDEFGQTSLARDKANQQVYELDGDGNPITTKPVSSATFHINVNKARKCTKADAKTSSGVIFNDPRYKATKYEITNEIIRLIDCAKPGSYIAMSWFSMTDENFVNHLIQADRAGVHVRVLLNSHAIQPKSASFTAYTTLKKQIGTLNGQKRAAATGGADSWVSYCKSGCLTPKAPKGLKFPNESEGEYPALHSKFFMFSELVNGDSVIGISSINPTYAQAVAGFNNTSIVVNDTRLFQSLSNYYRDLAVSAKTKGKKKAESYKNLSSKSKSTTYTTFPRLGSGGATDNITQTFDKVKCIYTEDGQVKRTKIYVNMFVFTRNSPAMKLWRLAHNSKLKGGGCEVHIIYTDMDQRIKALNTKTNRWGYIPNAGKVSNYGVADCLSTPATTKSGKVQRLTAPGKAWSAAENRYVAASVCKFGSLQGKMPTINLPGGYCWLQSKSSISGGSIDGCVSTPLGITAFDPADQRAKLESIADSSDKKWYSHQKYILIDGVVDNERTKLVISGTPNISSPGLRWNDEIITFSTSESVYKKYLNNYKMMRKAIKDRKSPKKDPTAIQAEWK